MKFTRNKIQSNSKFFILAIIFSLSFSFLFSSCEKEEEKPTEENKGSYYPLTTGSTWTYEDENGEVSTLTMTDQTKELEGFTWRIMDVSPNEFEFSVIVRFDEATQKVYQGFEGRTDADEPFAFATTVIDLDAEVGDTWTDRFENLFPDRSIIIEYKSTLLEKDVKKTVNGKSYDNVMVIEVDERVLPQDVDGLITNDYTLYFAKGIGMIAQEYEDGDYSRLIDYSIK